MKDQPMPNVPRKVVKCDRSGNDLREFSSAKEAALSLGFALPNAINKAIRHGNCAFGYRWRYADMPLYIKPEGTPGKSRAIVAIAENGDEEMFPSLSETSRKLGVGLTAIESALLMGCEAKGYHFRYEGETLAKSYKHERHKRKVVAIDDEGKIVAEYSCAMECANSRGVIKAAVYRCLKEKDSKAKCKGHRLRYKDEYSPDGQSNKRI